MAEDAKDAKHDKQGLMRMDQEGKTPFSKPRPLVETRPFRTDERGRPAATAADSDLERAVRQQPFALVEPKPK